jgi:hypothetical protein
LRILRSISAFLLLVIFVSGCSIFRTIENVSRLKYKIQNASDYKIAGISIGDKKSIKDFKALEALKITSSVMKGTLTVTFTVYIEAKNPNDGTGGYPRTDLSIQSFPWRLFINDNETVTGNIGEPVFVPGKGESTIIPINVEFDIAKNVKEKNIDDIIALTLQLGGIQKSTSNLKILVKPVIGTPLGNITYPDEITVVDKNFN